ncbi:MAG: hypothetical protein RBR54_01315 [Sulfurimonas sp.]|nr:hypothetical protein [Sulfurimonas sp.]
MSAFPNKAFFSLHPKKVKKTDNYDLHPKTIERAMFNNLFKF